MPIDQLRSYKGDCKVEISVRDPYQGRPLALIPEGRGLCAALVATEQFNTWKQWTMNLLLTRPGSFADLIRPLAQQENPRLWIRLGMHQGQETLWGEWDEHYLIAADLQPGAASEQRGGERAVLTTADGLYRMHRTYRVLSHQGSIGQIATGVARTSFERFAIETTAPGKNAYIQAYESDFDFLRRIQPAAINEGGHSNYLLFARGGALHFHTPAWQVRQVLRLDYQAQAVNDAANVAMNILAHTDDVIAGQGVTLISHDPMEGTSQTYATNPALETQFARETLSFPNARNEHFYAAHVGPNQFADLQSRVQNLFSSERLGFHRVRFTVTNNPFFAIGDVIVFYNFSDPAFDGLWLVSRLTYALDRGVLRSEVELTREGFTPSSVSASSTPQGRQINLGEISSSPQTRSVNGEMTLPDGSRVKQVTPAG